MERSLVELNYDSASSANNESKKLKKTISSLKSELEQKNKEIQNFEKEKVIKFLLDLLFKLKFLIF